MPSRNGMLITRRDVLKFFALGAFAAPVLLQSSASASQTGEEHMLIIYFSHSGNTRQLAGMIQRHAGGDMVELRTVNPYPQDYDSVVEVARQEQRADARPEISTVLSALEKYDTVCIGFPNWWGTLPMPFFTLLERYSLGNRTVIPFCTHEGSRFGRSISDLEKLCPEARILPGFEVRGSRVSGADDDVREWLGRIGLKVG